MAVVACSQCRQPFYASCHDGSCLDALCPACEYGEMSPVTGPTATPGTFHVCAPDARVSGPRADSMPAAAAPSMA